MNIKKALEDARASAQMERDSEGSSKPAARSTGQLSREEVTYIQRKRNASVTFLIFSIFTPYGAASVQNPPIQIAVLALTLTWLILLVVNFVAALRVAFKPSGLTLLLLSVVLFIPLANWIPIVIYNRRMGKLIKASKTEEKT